MVNSYKTTQVLASIPRQEVLTNLTITDSRNLTDNLTWRRTLQKTGFQRKFKNSSKRWLNQSQATTGLNFKEDWKMEREWDWKEKKAWLRTSLTKTRKRELFRANSGTLRPRENGNSSIYKINEAMLQEYK